MINHDVSTVNLATTNTNVTSTTPSETKKNYKFSDMFVWLTIMTDMFVWFIVLLLSYIMILFCTSV